MIKGVVCLLISILILSKVVEDMVPTSRFRMWKYCELLVLSVKWSIVFKRVVDEIDEILSVDKVLSIVLRSACCISIGFLVHRSICRISSTLEH